MAVGMQNYICIVSLLHCEVNVIDCVEERFAEIITYADESL
jgi:altronate dehydratase